MYRQLDVFTGKIVPNGTLVHRRRKSKCLSDPVADAGSSVALRELCTVFDGRTGGIDSSSHSRESLLTEILP